MSAHHSLRVDVYQCFRCMSEIVQKDSPATAEAPAPQPPCLAVVAMERGSASRSPRRRSTVSCYNMAGHRYMFLLPTDGGLPLLRKAIAARFHVPVFSVSLLQDMRLLSGDLPIGEIATEPCTFVLGGARQQCNLAAGCSHTAAITSSGRAWCWNLDGEHVLEAPKLQPDEALVVISAADEYTAAVTSNGRAVCWGDHVHVNELRYIPELQPNESFVTISAGLNFIAAITSRGRAICWGPRARVVQEIPTLQPDETFTTISAGAERIAAVTSLGRAVCWGALCEGSAVPELQPDELFVTVSVGWKFTAAVTSFGRAIAWGTWIGVPDWFRSSMPKLQRDEYFAAISVGSYHVATVTSRGRAVCWGEDWWRSTGSDIPVLQPDETFVSISAGTLHTAAITSKGRALCWNGFKQYLKVPQLDETFSTK